MSNTVQLGALPEDDVSKCVICSRTLQDPLLLQCLHSVCQACVHDTTAKVTCTICQMATDTSHAKNNILLSSSMHRARILKSALTCTHCIDDDKPDATAVTWCYACQTSLCVTHQKHHSKFHPNHKVLPVDEHTDLSNLYRPPVRSCKEHGEELKLACFTCQVGRCFMCAHECYTSSHDVQPLDGSTAAERMTSRVMAVTSALSDLRSTDVLLQTHLSLPGNVAGAMKGSLAELRNAKKTAIDSISRAYDKAEESLVECLEILISKADRLCASAEVLKKRVDWTIEYCQLALNTEDIAGLLPQLDTVCSSLRSLLEEVSQIKPLTDPLKLFSMNICVPCDLDLITSAWFGQATLASDSFDTPPNTRTSETRMSYYLRRVSTLNELEQLIETQKEEQNNLQLERLRLEQLLEQQRIEQADLQRKRQSVEQLGLELKLEQQQLAPSMPLCFDEKPRGTFKGPGTCLDVAVAPQGRLLVAASEYGLKEYEATSFREITTWKPDGDLLFNGEWVSVVTVDSLLDGRAVVGLQSKLIVLLRRNGSGGGSTNVPDNTEAWRAERRLVELQAPPRRLSAWGFRLLAVLEDRENEITKSWHSGPGLVLLSLSDGKQLHRQKLDYNACCVALSDRVVIVCSSDKVELAGTDGGSRNRKTSFVVDCYSHAGVRLWRHVIDLGLKVMSLCLDSVGRVLYAAKGGSVIAISTDDGQELSTAVKLSTKETKSPYAVALDRWTRSELVLISCDSGTPNHLVVFSVVSKQVA